MTDTPEIISNLLKMYNTSFLQIFYYFLFCKFTGILTMSRDVKILDCACGVESLLRVLKRLGFKNVDGFDMSPEMVGIARKITGYKVYCCDALHMNDVFLNNCAGVLKEGGLWINREPCVNSFIQCFF